MCSLRGIGNCSVEYQRFYALDIWSQYFPELNWDDEANSLSDFLDTSLENARNYDPEFKILYAYLYIMGDYLWGLTISDSWTKAKSKSSFTLNLLTTSLLNIDIERVYTQNKFANQISAIHFTFILPSETLNYSIVNNTVPDSHNG